MQRRTRCLAVCDDPLHRSRGSSSLRIQSLARHMLHRTDAISQFLSHWALLLTGANPQMLPGYHRRIAAMSLINWRLWVNRLWNTVHYSTGGRGLAFVYKYEASCTWGCGHGDKCVLSHSAVPEAALSLLLPAITLKPPPPPSHKRPTYLFHSSVIFSSSTHPQAVVISCSGVPFAFWGWVRLHQCASTCPALLYHYASTRPVLLSSIRQAGYQIQ